MIITAFLILLIVGAFCLCFGLKLLAKCADISADLPDYIRAVEMLAVSTMLLANALVICPFRLVLI